MLRYFPESVRKHRYQYYPGYDMELGNKHVGREVETMRGMREVHTFQKYSGWRYVIRMNWMLFTMAMMTTVDLVVMDCLRPRDPTVVRDLAFQVVRNDVESWLMMQCASMIIMACLFQYFVRTTTVIRVPTDGHFTYVTSGLTWAFIGLNGFIQIDLMKRFVKKYSLYHTVLSYSDQMFAFIVPVLTSAVVLSGYVVFFTLNTSMSSSSSSSPSSMSYSSHVTSRKHHDEDDSNRTIVRIHR